MSIDKDTLGGDYARDTEEGFGGDYARDGGWSGGGKHDDVVREEPIPDGEEEVGIGKASE